MNLFPSLPHFGTYRVIACDWPWKYSNYGQKKHGASLAHYPGLDPSVARDMPVGELAHPGGALLAFWATSGQEADGAHHVIAEAWGFKLRTKLITWVKVYEKCQLCEHHWDRHDPPDVTQDFPGFCGAGDGCECEAFVSKAVRGPGSYSMQGTESLWLGVRGDFHWSSARAVRDVPEPLFDLALEPHSTKPERAYSRIERLWPDAAPRLELFARRRRPGWAAWGNEAPECDLVFGTATGSSWPVPEPAEVVHRDVKPENLLFAEESESFRGPT